MEFFNSLLTELEWKHEDELELSSLCQNGGSPKDGSLRFADFGIRQRVGELVHGTFKVTITESTGDSCSHIAGEKNRFGLLEFTLNVRSGDIELGHSAFEKREYDPYEL